MTEITTTPEAFPQDFERALNAGDLDRICALYDDHAVLHVQAGEIRSGATAVRDEMRQLIEAGAQITNALRLTFRHDDIALIVVDYVLRLTTAGGDRVELSGTATNVIQDQGDDGWRMIIANPQGVA